MKEEYYKEFCILFKGKLKELLKPALGDKGVRSYTALTDILTNIILFEMNIDKQPWEQIPKREVENDYNNAVKQSLDEASQEQLVKVLIEKLKYNNDFYKEELYDYGITPLKKENYQTIALVMLLENFLTTYD